MLVILLFAAILSMHRLDATFAHPGHVSAAGHGSDVPGSAARALTAGGSCVLEGATSAPGPVFAACPVGMLAGTRPVARHSAPAIVVFANRAVLTAFSILRI